MKYLKYFENIDWNEDWEEEDPYESKDIPVDKPIKSYEQYIGRKVMIKPNSVFYKGIPTDPKDKVGDIVSLTDSDKYIFNVKWDETHYNVYGPDDLVLVD